MIIKSHFMHNGVNYGVRWEDADSFKHLSYEKCQQIYGVCFFGDKIIVCRKKPSKSWNLIGGHIEKGELIENALIREILEESNMKVLKHVPIGYQEVVSPDGTSLLQLRSVGLVEPIGPFEEDPAGSVDEIKLINPEEYKNYFDWGKIGDRIIQRALELKKSGLS